MLRPNSDVSKKNLSLILAQLNPVMGDLAGNAARLLAVRRDARHADLILTPELYLVAYPPEDLVLKSSFLDEVEKTVQELANATADCGAAILLGAPWREGGKLHNAMLLLDGGKIAGRVFKSDLPNYGVFDEKRVFAAAPLPQPLEFRGHKLGVMICEDMWTPAASAYLKKQGAAILIVPNGSPFETAKREDRLRAARARVEEVGLPLVYLNRVGGQDELVFDGASFVLNARGEPVAQMKAWEEEVVLTRLDNTCSPAPGIIQPLAQGEEDIYAALMLGLRDYVARNGFPGILLGLSGGIDSALVAALAADALGPEKLHAVAMPSPYSAAISTEDAAEMAGRLGCSFEIIPIAPAMETFAALLAKPLQGKTPGVTEENIQARCRGLILMALSNASGSMVLSTGNKSEMAVGYATLYGDMCGGFAVLKDVYKTDVYRLARWRNSHRVSGALGAVGAVIPERIITRAPTAELRPNQTDQDSLPPYDVLDSILHSLIEHDQGVAETVALGHDAATVRRVAAMLSRAEYKRRQSPPGTKITRRTLGKDRRYPITNGYGETERG